MKEDRLVQEIIAVERAWVQAIQDVDVDALADLMADDYAVIGVNGRVSNKAEDLDSYRTDRKWEYAESDEYDIRVYGDTAVLIGRWRAKGINNDDHFDYSARFISLYVKQSDRWRMVTSQSTTIPYQNHIAHDDQPRKT